MAVSRGSSTLNGVVGQPELSPWKQNLVAPPQLQSCCLRRAPPTLRGRHRPRSPRSSSPHSKLVRDGPCLPCRDRESRRAGLRLSPEDHTGLASESSRTSSSRSRPHFSTSRQPFCSPCASGRHSEEGFAAGPHRVHPATHEISVSCQQNGSSQLFITPRPSFPRSSSVDSFLPSLEPSRS